LWLILRKDLNLALEEHPLVGCHSFCRDDLRRKIPARPRVDNQVNTAESALAELPHAVEVTEVNFEGGNSRKPSHDHGARCPARAENPWRAQLNNSTSPLLSLCSLA
jgi:hypothetical protein